MNFSVKTKCAAAPVLCHSLKAEGRDSFMVHDLKDRQGGDCVSRWYKHKSSREFLFTTTGGLTITNDADTGIFLLSDLAECGLFFLRV